MWLITKHGFYSIVQKTEDADADTLTVRGRVRGDMEFLARKIEAMGLAEKPEIIVTPRGDYKYRFRIDRGVFQAVVSSLAGEIDYDNFKATQHDPNRHHAYMHVWANLARLQD
jgi:hypothetical protein